ncbi:hypothetical protein CLOHIR_01627 [Peptacetobacter hiranonis DSM 13275]|uniref:Uncharacterized protein n=1 Tax=Peptacetobacter hiranonis (strain DSM 13275 / JCM 10541 / KCTC 15199 / TO-931) TaxID=500633 RepID=B6G0H1_PEPHT|nr:hypothetical protein [Peptacetobacter hiranonis]EEA84781.1 hypothetical protein CLOHIR_01627 [Peptacetobacter hiranonis DSM 13275]
MLRKKCCIYDKEMDTKYICYLEKSNLLSIFLERYEEKVENINIFER